MGARTRNRLRHLRKSLAFVGGAGAFACLARLRAISSHHLRLREGLRPITNPSLTVGALMGTLGGYWNGYSLTVS